MCKSIGDLFSAHTMADPPGLLQALLTGSSTIPHAFSASDSPRLQQAHLTGSSKILHTFSAPNSPGLQQADQMGSSTIPHAFSPPNSPGLQQGHQTGSSTIPHAASTPISAGLRQAHLRGSSIIPHAFNASNSPGLRQAHLTGSSIIPHAFNAPNSPGLRQAHLTGSSIIPHAFNAPNSPGLQQTHLTGSSTIPHAFSAPNSPGLLQVPLAGLSTTPYSISAPFWSSEITSGVPQAARTSVSEPSQSGFHGSQAFLQPPRFSLQYAQTETLGLGTTDPSESSFRDSQTILHPPQPSQQCPQTQPVSHLLQPPTETVGLGTTDPSESSFRDSQTILYPPQPSQQCPHMQPVSHLLHPPHPSFPELQDIPTHLHPFHNIFGGCTDNFDQFKRNQKRHRLAFKPQKHRLSLSRYINHKAQKHFRRTSDCNKDKFIPTNDHNSKLQLDKTNVGLDHRYAMHYSEDKTYVECTYCGEVMDMDDLKHHMVRRHQQKTSKCCICRKEYFFASSLWQHLASHGIKVNSATEPKKEWTVVRQSKKRVCPVPEDIPKKRGFRRSKKRVRPIPKFHPTRRMCLEPKDTFKCTYCKELILPSQLREHLSAKHDLELVETSVCFVCNEEFTTTDEVIEHIKTHRSYLFKSCSSKQNTTTDAMQPQSSHAGTGVHQGDQEKKECFSLNENTTQIPPSQRESRGHPMENKAEDNLKCFICEVQFNSVDKFMVHLASHTAYKVNSVTEGHWYLFMKRDVIPLTQNEANLHSHQVLSNVSDASVEPNSFPDMNDTLAEKLFQNKVSSSTCDMNSNASTNRKKQEYVCQICLKVFRYTKVYMEHMANAHKDANKPESDRNKCSVCLQVLPNSTSLRQHYLSHHPGIYYTCNACHTICDGLDELTAHVQKHHSESAQNTAKYACQHCNETFSKFLQLSAHRQAKHPETLYKCTQCDKAFVRESLLERHMAKGRHDTSQACKICGEIFPSYHHLNTHTANVHTKKMYKCQLCEKSFAVRSVYNTHLDSHRPKMKTRKPNSSKNKCRACGERFRDTEELRQHRITNHIRNKMCEICGKEMRAESYGVHMKRHRQQLDHQCQLCGRKFLTNSQLNSHLNTHADVGSRTLYKCMICGKEFLRKQGLQQHLMRHDGITDTKVDPRKRCTYCGKQLSTVSALKDHVRIHTGEKPHKCSICGKGFAKKCNVKDHERVHMGTQKKRQHKKDVIPEDE